MQEESMKIKVLYIITKGNFGGAQRYVFDLATHLPRDKYDVVVACGEGDVLPTKLSEKNVRVIRVPFLERDIHLSNEWRVFKTILSLIDSEKPQILHLNSSKIGGIGALAGRIKGVKKIIFTAHGWVFNEQRGQLSKLLITFFQWFTILLCHTTIAVSEKTKRDIAWLPFIGHKIQVIHNGVDTFKTQAKHKARELLAGIENKDKIIFYSLSELHKNKGLDVALDALSLLPHERKQKIVYAIAGTGEEREKLEIKIKRSDLGNLAKLHGFIPEANALLCGADVFLLPSRTEALPYALLEAGRVGAPTIATSVGGIPEVVRDMQSGILVHPQNPKELAEAILYMLDHKDKRKEFGAEIKKTVTTFFTLEKMLEETYQLYNSFH